MHRRLKCIPQQQPVLRERTASSPGSVDGVAQLAHGGEVSDDDDDDIAAERDDTASISDSSPTLCDAS